MSIWQIQNLNPNNKIYAFGHGGMGIKNRYPMNSFESLQEVLNIGADGTEMDLQLSKDKVLVLFHHGKLEDASNGKGLIRNSNWADIQALNYKWPLFNKTKIISMDDFFNRITINSKHIFTFDCKVEAEEDPDYLNQFVEQLYLIIDKHHLQNQCFIESYNFKFLYALSKLDTRLKLFVHSENYKDGLAISKQLNLYGLTLDRLKITKEEISNAHQNGLHITLYNMVNPKENLEAVQMNPDFLQGDDMDHLIKVVKQ